MKRRVVTLVAGAAMLLALSASAAFAGAKYPVSVGFSYGSWTPSLDTYGLRWVDQANPTVTTSDGLQTLVTIRQPLDTITTPLNLAGYSANRIPFTFSSAGGFGLYSKLRLHNDMFALFEYDWWSQSIGSARNYGGLWGYEQYDLSMSPVTVSLVYEMPTELDSRWWPNLYLGFGAGVVLVERATTQITNDTYAHTVSSGVGTILTGLGGIEYAIPVPALEDRLSLFVEGRYLTGDFTEQFSVLSEQGSALLDSTGAERKVDKDVSIQGPHIKFGMFVNFGQIRPRPEKGVLSGLLEPSRRTSTRGYAMVPGYSAPPTTGGFALVYPQSPEQVQVVQGAGHIDEDRIRQIIREELVGARITSGGVREVDDLAEQQLRAIRERRLQAEQELEQLKELLREEG